VGGAPITITDTAAKGFVALQHCNNAWLTYAGLAATADPVRTTSGPTTSAIDGDILIETGYSFRSSFSSFATLAAIRRAFIAREQLGR
jgi:hypothetical protein